MAQEKVNGTVEALNGVGRDFVVVALAGGPTDGANLEPVVAEIQSQNISISAIGEVGGASVNMMIEGFVVDGAGDPVLPTVTGYTLSVVAF